MARRFIYLVATFFLSALGILAVAPAAWAHATLVTTNPADGAILKTAPSKVSATFDEPVGVSSDSLKVFAPNGARVDTGGTTHGSKPQEIVVALKTGLGHGTYTVGWHVISADSHPVQGAWTFSIGAPSKSSVNTATINTTANPLIGIIFGAVRWIAFCCFALLIGAVAFVLWCWPAGASSPLVLRLTMAAWGGLATSVLGALLLQGIYGGGQGVTKVFWPNVLHATLYSRYGRSLGVRLILVIVALFVFTAILGRLRERQRASVTSSVLWAVLAAALAATWAAADHAGVGIQVPLSLASDTTHLSAVAIWLGGLTMLATIVLRNQRGRGAKAAGRSADRKARTATADAVQAVERFSPIALGCVGAILLTGTYQAWRGVGSWPALFDTVYGRLLLIKIGAMCVLIALGYVARVRIAALRAPTTAAPGSVMELVAAALPRVGVGARSGQGVSVRGWRPGNGHGAGGDEPNEHRSNGHSGNGHSGNGSLTVGYPLNGSSPDAGGKPVTLRRLRWSVAAEAMIATAVLAVTAVLVNTPTARETFTQPVNAAVVFNTGGPGGRGNINITMTPAALGSNQISVSVTNGAGKPYSPKQLNVSLELPARHLGPLAVALKSTGPGRYTSQSVTMTITGQWQLQIAIRSDAFDETTVTIPIPVQ
ncbi:MAG TPA: FixH family protein [Streptosporangiaceae bacterium]